MSSSSWRTPFMELRDQFKSMYDSNMELFHSVVLVPDMDNFDELLLDEIEAAQEGREVIQRLVTPTDTFVYHAHFFGVLKSVSKAKPMFHPNWQRFVDILSGAENWIRKIPNFPKFISYPAQNQQIRDVIAWTNLVYYLAGRVNRPYLSVMVEHYNGELFETFKTWPKPRPANLLPALIHEQDPITSILKLSDEFKSEGYELPCMIDAYLEGSPMVSDLVQASAIAVDCLLFMMDGLNQTSDTSDRKPTRTRSTTKEVEIEINLLRAFLIAAIQSQMHSNKPTQPLTQKEIAFGMKWTKDGKNGTEANEVKVTRRMEAIFGPKPQVAYEAAFKTNSSRKGLLVKLSNLSTIADGVVEPDDIDLD